MNPSLLGFPEREPIIAHLPDLVRCAVLVAVLGGVLLGKIVGLTPFYAWGGMTRSVSSEYDTLPIIDVLEAQEKGDQP